MNIRDFHLLPILERLIATKSVTASARDLNMSTPAVSRALGRLRQCYGDELLVRSGRKMSLTPRAESLYPTLKSCLDSINSMDSPNNAQELRYVERSFRIRCDDVFAGILSHRLFEVAHSSAPRIRITLVSEGASSEEDLRTGNVDLEVGGRESFQPEIIVRPLGEQQILGLVGQDHPLLKKRIKPEQFVSYPHVLTPVQLDFERPVKQALEALGLKRSIDFIVPSLYSAGLAVSQSQMVATMPEVMAKQLAEHLPVSTFDLPFKLKPIKASVSWHSRFQADFAHQWMREQIIKIASSALLSG